MKNKSLEKLEKAFDALILQGKIDAANLVLADIINLENKLNY